MAENGYLIQAQPINRANLLKIEKVVQITLDGSGKGTTDVNLDRAFVGIPVLMIAKPVGSSTGVYKAGYLASTPKITVTTDSATDFTSYVAVTTTSGDPSSQAAVAEAGGFLSRTVEVILYGIEQP